MASGASRQLNQYWIESSDWKNKLLIFWNCNKGAYCLPNNAHWTISTHGPHHKFLISVLCSIILKKLSKTIPPDQIKPLFVNKYRRQWDIWVFTYRFVSLEQWAEDSSTAASRRSCRGAAVSCFVVVPLLQRRDVRRRELRGRTRAARHHHHFGDFVVGQAQRQLQTLVCVDWNTQNDAKLYLIAINYNSNLIPNDLNFSSLVGVY